MAARKQKTQQGGRKRGSIIPAGPGKWIVRVAAGPLGDCDKRRYIAKTVIGTYQQADKVRTELLGNRDQGMLVIPTTQTLQAYLESWLTTAVPVSVSVKTRQSYRWLMEHYTYPFFGRMKLRDVAPQHIQAFVQHLVDRKLSRRTVAYSYGTLKAALQQAVVWRQLPFNPAAGVRLPAQLPQKQRRFAALTAQQAYTVIKGSAGRFNGAFWTLLLHTGMRPGECAALTWQDVKENRLTISKALVQIGPSKYAVGPTKTRTERIITLPQAAVDALAVHRARQAKHMMLMGPEYTRNDLIFATRTGGHLSLTNLSKAWRATLKRLGLPKVTMYNCRHTHISLLLAANEPIKAVQERVGHATPKMILEIYQQVFPEMEAATASTFDALMRKAAANQ